MIRFPYLEGLTLDPDDMAILKNNVYVIFAKTYLSDNIFSPIIGEQIQSNLMVQKAEEILYNNSMIDQNKQQIQENQKKNIADIITIMSLADVAGLKCTEEMENIFGQLTAFETGQNIKNQIIRLGSANKSWTPALFGQFKETVHAISDSDTNALQTLKSGLQKIIDKQNFDNVITFLCNLLGQGLNMYCDGYHKINNFTIPPLNGIEKDIQNYIFSTSIQEKIQFTNQGQKIVKVFTNPHVQLLSSMIVRVCDNYFKIAQQKQYEEEQRIQKLKGKNGNGTEPKE